MELNRNQTGMAATLVLGLIATSMSCSTAYALTVSASDPFIRVRATSGAFTGTISVPLGDVFVFNDVDLDVFYWATTDPVPIFDGPNLVATLVNMTVLAGRNTQPDGEQRFGIDIDFGVQAGGSTTMFELISPTLTFGPLSNARALASAGIVGTDQNTNGITITPMLSSGFGFAADYNGATNFRSYLGNTLTNVPSGSVGDAGNMVPSGVFQPIAGSVSDMTSTYKFSLTGGDTAGGTTTFSVAPAPGSITLIGLAGLVMGRRRR